MKRSVGMVAAACVIVNTPGTMVGYIVNTTNPLAHTTLPTLHQYGVLSADGLRADVNAIA